MMQQLQVVCVWCPVPHVMKEGDGSSPLVSHGICETAMQRVLATEGTER